MTDTLPMPPPKASGIYVSKPPATAEGFERWRRKNSWMDNTGSGLFHHIGNFEVLSFEELFTRYKETL